MAEKMQVYKCGVCGNIVYVVHGGAGELVCCGEPMKLMKENTVDASKEKHVPVIERGPNNLVTVRVGSVPHPMEEKHYIEWIELVAEGRSQFKYLMPGDRPEAQFLCGSDKLGAREYCNLHGLWKA
jgi:superoxide reductase